MSISQNTALFSLLGTTYGGDGKSTFALPNLQGCAPMQQGQGPGLSLRDLGEVGGEQTVTLLQTEMPVHSHTFTVGTGSRGELSSPANNVPANAPSGSAMYSTGSASNANMGPQALATAGGSQPHNNMMPFLALTFIIALQGVFPARS